MHAGNEDAGKRFRTQFVDLNAADDATHVTGNALDRAYIPKAPAGTARMDEFASSTFTIVTPPPGGELAFQHDLSDHFPIVITLVEMPDAD
jgi:hypothetical protein